MPRSVDVEAAKAGGGHRAGDVARGVRRADRQDDVAGAPQRAQRSGILQPGARRARRGVGATAVGRPQHAMAVGASRPAHAGAHLAWMQQPDRHHATLLGRLILRRIDRDARID